MLQIHISSVELWDELNEQFITTKSQLLTLEHSLVSLSKWESKWCKPFLTKSEKTHEELIDYVRCMTITQNVDPTVYEYLSAENMRMINDYINSPMTATKFPVDENRKINRETMTSEKIYYSMIALNIPFECQKWHLNRLIALIRVCNDKNKPSKKKNMKEIMSRNAALNAARRKQLNTKG